MDASVCTLIDPPDSFNELRAAPTPRAVEPNNAGDASIAPILRAVRALTGLPVERVDRGGGL